MRHRFKNSTCQRDLRLYGPKAMCHLHS